MALKQNPSSDLTSAAVEPALSVVSATAAANINADSGTALPSGNQNDQLSHHETMTNLQPTSNGSDVPAAAATGSGAPVLPETPVSHTTPAAAVHTSTRPTSVVAGSLPSTQPDTATPTASPTTAPVGNQPPSIIPSSAAAHPNSSAAPEDVALPTPNTSFTDDAAFSAAFGPCGPGAVELQAKLFDIRAVAVARDYYLGCGPADIMRRVKWMGDGGSNVVVDRDAAIATMEARAAYAARPLDNPVPTSPSLAHLYIIGTISSEQCFLRSDGYVNPNAPFKQTLSGTTLACALVPPPDDYPFLVNDYNTAVSSLDTLAKDIKQPSESFKFPKFAPKHIRIRHKLFRLKADGDPPTGDLPADFQTATWPLCSAQAKTERDGLLKTHSAHPLRAFDVTGDLMHPSAYRPLLCGATVLAGLSVTHFSILGKNTICLDIEYLRVLIPGVQRSSTKRGAIHMSDPLSHASGKRRAI